MTHDEKQQAALETGANRYGLDPNANWKDICLRKLNIRGYSVPSSEGQISTQGTTPSPQ